MYWRICKYLVAVLCAATDGLPQSASPNMEELVQAAMARNRELLSLRERIAEAKGLLRQAGVRPSPVIEVEAGTGRPLGTRGEEEYSVGYLYPVETGGKRPKRVLVAEQSIAVAQAELDDRARLLSADVRLAAIETLSQREKLAALDRLSKVIGESARLTEARIREGDAARLDGQLLLVEQNRTEAQRASVAGGADAAVMELRRLIGFAPSDTVPLAESLPPESRSPVLEQLQQTARQQRPDLRIARILEQQSGAEVTLAAAQGSPDITLSARYTYRTSQFDQFGLAADGTRAQLRDQDNVVTFGASIPLFSGKRNQGNVEASTARAAAAKFRREHLEATVPLEVEAAYRRWRAAYQVAGVFERGIVGQSEQNLSVIRQAYQLGQLRLLDVLNEQRRLVETELSHIDAKAALLRSIVELERVTGASLP